MNRTQFVNLVTSKQSLKELPANTVTKVVTYLIKHERQPGGPYDLSDSAQENVNLNLNVALLFSQIGKTLPGTVEYLQSSKDVLSEEARKRLRNLVQNKQDLKTSVKQRQEIDVFLESSLPPEAYSQINDVVKRVKAVDKNGEITQLSTSLINSSARQFSEKIRTQASQLGAANFCTWLAYSLIDQVLDVPTTQTSLIPAAQLLITLSKTTYLNNGVSLRLLDDLYNTVDQANLDESLYCRLNVTDKSIELTRLPNRRLLKELMWKKSIAHCLGPFSLYVSELKGSARDAKQVFSQYCALKQMNDDIHDWEQDLRQGHITYVVGSLLRAAKITDGTHDIETLTHKLQDTFWDSHLELLLKECQHMAMKLRTDYTEVFGLIKNSHFDSITVTPIIKSLESALKQHEFDKKFISTI